MLPSAAIRLVFRFSFNFNRSSRKVNVNLCFILFFFSLCCKILFSCNLSVSPYTAVLMFKKCSHWQCWNFNNWNVHFWRKLCIETETDNSKNHSFSLDLHQIILKRINWIECIYILSDDWLKTCQIDDPNFDACSRESIQGLFKQLTTGECIKWCLISMLYCIVLTQIFVYFVVQVLRDLPQLKQSIQWNWIVSRYSRVTVPLALIHHFRKRQ